VFQKDKREKVNPKPPSFDPDASRDWYARAFCALTDGDAEALELELQNVAGIDPQAVANIDLRVKHPQAIIPHYGPQSEFLASQADITLLGGGAGGAKSFGLLMRVAQYAATVPGWTAMVFRRTLAEVRNPGGLADEGKDMYDQLPVEGRLNQQHLSYRFKGFGRVKFGHLVNKDTHYDHKGGQYGDLAFDELTSFLREQFMYTLSRNRAPRRPGMPKARCSGTTNPDRNSWVFDFVRPWVDPDCPLYPTDPKHTRYFRRHQDEIPDHIKPHVLWRSTDGGLSDIVWVTSKCPDALSFRYIPSTVLDNPSLGGEYRAQLESMSRIERARLLHGDWLISATAGEVFDPGWFRTVDAPGEVLRTIRAWDLNTVAEGKKRETDYTVGVLMGIRSDGSVIVLDVVRVRGTSAQVEAIVLRTAKKDGKYTQIRIEQLPAAAGAWMKDSFERLLRGYSVEHVSVGGGRAQDKVTRAMPYSAAAERGEVELLSAPWNQAYIDEHEGFPDARHDDQVDASTLAYHCISGLGTPAKVRFGKSKPSHKRNHW
ncbi:MAG: phage terminase large subunit, partial [Nannocystaceae bacterium]